MDILFTSASIKRLFFFLLVTGLTFFIFSGEHNSQAYWLVWSALLLSLIMTGNTFLHRINTLWLTGLTAALAVMLTGSLTTFMPLLAFCLFVITLSGMAAMFYRPEYYLPMVIIVLSAILSSGFAPSVTENLDRGRFVIEGLGITLLCQLVFLPFYLRNQLRFVLFIALYNLRELNREIFSCLLQLEYADNIYLFERRLHIQKNKCVNAIARLRKLLAVSANLCDGETPETLLFLQLTSLERLYEGMLDYAQLRRRVSDVNTFAVCKEEFLGLSQAIDSIFKQLMRAAANKSHDLELETVDIRIRRMEENYHNVIQIAAREPLVFLLFISSMNSFRAALRNFYESMRKVPEK